uniref:ENIGMA class LIM protein ML108023b n=1 Tax=Mnemiopsis leidyi TaxID=27923 RepID=H2DJX2_MNELE|nr:ENIGMA class LIM protein ML108023b [Mnemiopsis leidyi]
MVLVEIFLRPWELDHLTDNGSDSRMSNSEQLSASQNISIVLPGSVPFGFKMQGGREYRAPLTILSVSAGSKAFTQGLRDGDVLLKINSSVTHNLEHTEAMKLIKTAKGGLNLTLTRVTSTREEALQAMKQFSEEMEVPPPPLEHTDSVSLLPPPPADLEPPPPAELDLPPPPSLDMADLPPPPPEDDLPPAPPDTVEVPAPPAAPPAPPAPAKPAAAPPSKVPLGKLTPATPPGTPPTVALKPVDMSYRPSRKASLDIPKSALTQFGEEVISIAHSRENSGDTNMAAVPRSGKFFKLLQSQLDEMKAGTDSLPKYTFPGYNISPAPADGTKSPEIAPCPTPATPATPATPPAVAPKPSNVQKSSASFNLMSMAYSPSPTKSPSQPPTFSKSPTGNIANGTAIKPAPTVKPASTCTSPLPKFQNSDTPPLLSRQGSRSSVNQTPVKPRMVSLVDDSPPDPDTEEVTKQSPSLSKLMFGSGNPPAPTFNSPDRGYNRAATTNGAASHPGVTPSPSNGSVTPSNGSVTSPSTLGSTTEAPTTPKTSNGGTVNGGITPGGTANGGSSPGDNAKGGKKSLFTSNPILLPICKSCHQEIRGPYVGAQGRAWHSEHFVCTVCDGDLSQGFKEVDEKLFCGTCYFERFGEKCANCGKTCVGSVIQALGQSYHPEHFTCFECGNVLKEGFNVDNGNPYCSACHTNFLPLCAGCNKRIEGATQWISALEKDWHNGCFACGVCRAPLAGSSFYHDGQGKALCQVHARAASRPVA